MDNSVEIAKKLGLPVIRHEVIEDMADHKKPPLIMQKP